MGTWGRHSLPLKQLILKTIYVTKFLGLLSNLEDGLDVYVVQCDAHRMEYR